MILSHTLLILHSATTLILNRVRAQQWEDSVDRLEFMTTLILVISNSRAGTVSSSRQPHIS